MSTLSIAAPKLGKQLGGILLVSGTTVGAGMLALPVVSGAAGFFPSALLLIFYWLLSTATALLMLEVNLWFKQPVNLITMVRHTLGKPLELIAWVVYLLLLYSLTAAYLSASGPMVSDVVKTITGCKLATYAEPLPFFILFGGFIYLGIRPVDYLNRLLMIGLAISYLALLATATQYLQPSLLTKGNPASIWMAIPVIATSYGFHIIIPSLTTYLQRDVKALRRTILIGSAIPLLVYLLLQFVVLGVVPIPALNEALTQGDGIVRPLSAILQNSSIGPLAKLFSFFAIVTSFLGVGLSLFHFFADGLKIEQTPKGKLFTALCTFAVPVLFTLFYPRGFILALEYAGIFVAILLGLFPILMAWKGRKHNPTAPYTVAGGTPLLITLLLCICMGAVYMIKEVF